jgi:ribosomal RNA-processing protein 36
MEPLRTKLKANTNGFYKPVHVELQPKYKRRSKTAPMELTAKIPVSRFKKVKFYKAGEDPSKGLLLKKNKPRDPRFDKLSGTYNEHLFKLSYKFLDDYRVSELAQLQEELRTAQDSESRRLVQRAINKKKEEVRQLDRKQREHAVKKELEGRTKEAVKQGKQPFFFNKKLVKMLAAKKQLEELKQQGSLEAFTAKRQKRERTKEAKKIREVVGRKVKRVE